VLELGSIDDEDHTYVQGALVGNTDNWQAQRRYRVPAAQTDAEVLTLAVRVRDGAGPGGFNGPREALRLYPEGGEADALSLAGDWRMQVGSTVNPPPDQHKPAHLYNGMLHPLRAMTLRGVIWYQGENNAIGPESAEYQELFPAFVRDLRAAFGRPALPFVFVQLPNFAENDSTFWYYPVVRDAQLRAFRELDNVGMAVTTDIGDPKNIHPKNKLDVGRRLARWALARIYDVSQEAPTGPIFQAASFDGAEARVTFETWGGALRAEGGAPLGGFELAGEDRVFHPAAAELAGDDAVVVRSPAVPRPVALRYAWANDPADANLVGDDDLPASPFRTDDWPVAGRQ
jgi:sialate O-acetylesterase